MTSQLVTTCNHHLHAIYIPIDPNGDFKDQLAVDPSPRSFDCQYVPVEKDESKLSWGLIKPFLSASTAFTCTLYELVSEFPPGSVVSCEQRPKGGTTGTTARQHLSSEHAERSSIVISLTKSIRAAPLQMSCGCHCVCRHSATPKYGK